MSTNVQSPDRLNTTAPAEPLMLTEPLRDRATPPDLGGFEDRIDWLFATLPQLVDDADTEAARVTGAAAK